MSNPPKRGAHRHDPLATRVTRAWRVHPLTAKAILDGSRSEGCNQGQFLDRLLGVVSRPGEPKP